MTDVVIRGSFGDLPAAPPKPVVHSWSSFNTFEQCPWRWYLTKIKKTVSEGQSEQMREGNERHKALELAVRDGAPLPDKYVGDAPIVSSMRNSPGIKIVEWQFGLTRNWTETTFFAKDVWVRGKIDVGVIGKESAVLIDYKTGKPKEDYDQLGLFAIPAFVKWPYLQKIKTAYLWLGTGKLDPKDYKPTDLPGLKTHFAHRFMRVEDAVARNKFPKIPSGLCRAHCPVGRANCEYYGGDKP